MNGTFGSNVPELMALISNELDLMRKHRNKEIDRTFYELSEMVPAEQIRFNAQKAIDEVWL